MTLQRGEVFVDRTEKEAQVAELKELFTGSSAAIVVDYRGLPNNKVVELRKELHKASSNIKVLKNTLARIAAEGTPLAPLKDEFVQTRALVLSNNAVEQAKVISTFAKANDKLQIKGGLLVEGQRTTLLNKAQVEELSKLPSREELIAKVLFLMNAPITQFVRTLNEIPSSFVRVLSAVADSKNQ